MTGAPDGRALVARSRGQLGPTAHVLRALPGPDGRAEPADRLAARLGIATETVAAVLAAVDGLAAECTSDGWRLRTDEMGRALALAALDGAEAYRSARGDTAQGMLALTMPQAPSRLAAAFTRRGIAAGRHVRTEEAFERIAQRATQRFVVMTPFLDEDGARWLVDLYARCASSVERIFICRDFDRALLPLLIRHGGRELAAMEVRILEYHAYRADDRALPIETFHAKVVAGDGTAAYVGSANMLRSSREFSFEMGFLFEGAAAGDVWAVLGAIMEVSADRTRP